MNHRNKTSTTKVATASLSLVCKFIEFANGKAKIYNSEYREKQYANEAYLNISWHRIDHAVIYVKLFMFCVFLNQ